MTSIPNAGEPVRILANAEGELVAVSASTAEGVKWSMVKFALMRDKGLTSDQAELEVQIQMAAEAKEKRDE